LWAGIWSGPHWLQRDPLSLNSRHTSSGRRSLYQPLWGFGRLDRGAVHLRPRICPLCFTAGRDGRFVGHKASRLYGKAGRVLAHRIVGIAGGAGTLKAGANATTKAMVVVPVALRACCATAPRFRTGGRMRRMGDVGLQLKLPPLAMANGRQVRVP